MGTYQPGDGGVAMAVGALLASEVGLGYALMRWAPRGAAARGLAWAGLGLGTVGVERLVGGEPPGVRMVALIGFALLGLKGIVALEERGRGMPPLSWTAWLGFACGWPGMAPGLFVAPTSGPLPGARELVVRGLGRLAAGGAVLGLARLAWVWGQSRVVASALALVGLSLAVHFGLCNVLAGAWRARGVGCEALFVAPLEAQSLGEFWGRRWNRAFTEMTQAAVYRPLVAWSGRRPALLAAFALSGLLHEMAISVPVRSGHGWPLLYFLIHGGLVAFERARARAGRPVGGGWGRVWVVVWTAAPLPLLFHRPFLAALVWPLVGIPAGD